MVTSESFGSGNTVKKHKVVIQEEVTYERIIEAPIDQLKVLAYDDWLSNEDDISKSCMAVGERSFDLVDLGIEPFDDAEVEELKELITE